MAKYKGPASLWYKPKKKHREKIQKKTQEKTQEKPQEKPFPAAVKTRKLLSRRRHVSKLPKTKNHIAFIFVGQADNRTLMTVHTGLIPSSTQAFLTNTAYLGLYVIDEDIEVAEIWRQFLYNGKLYIKQDVEDEEWGWLTDAYLMGVHIKDERFCNTVINAMIDKQFEEDSYPTTLASVVWGRTEPGDRLRELIVDFHTWAGQGVITADSEDAESGPADLKLMVHHRARRWAKLIYSPTAEYPWTKPCLYHKHDTSRRCQASAA